MGMLDIELTGMKLQNPTILASGFLGVSAESMKKIQNSGAGAVTMKSVGPKEREGHNNPTVIAVESYMLNAVGLPCVDYKNMDEEWKILETLKIPLIGSSYGHTVEDYANVSAELAKHKVGAIELDMSCPHMEKGGAAEFSSSTKAAAEVVGKVKDAVKKVPIYAKLSPNVPNIGEIAKACEEAGADGITAINTVGPGMIIDLEAKKPVLGFKKGGVSGPAIKPVAVRCVYDIYQAVDIPIIGTGGVTYGKDAIEIMMAGATGVGVGTAIYYRGQGAFKSIAEEMEKWLKDHGYSKLKDVIGEAHNGGKK